MEKKTQGIAPPKDPAWKELEKIVAEIQQTVAPDAIVTHNDRIVGKSGTSRKIDVSIKQKIGLNPMLIAIDCKHHARPVEKGDVAVFAEQVEDIGPCVGIMISDLSFDSGAKYVARKENIILKTFTEAVETDWKQLFGEQPFAFITLSTWTIQKAWIPESSTGGVASTTLIPLNPGTGLFTNEGKNYPLNREAPSVLGDLFSLHYKSLPRPKPIGTFKEKISQMNPAFCFLALPERKIICPPYILVEGTILHKKYPITYQVARGRSLKSIGSNKLEAMKVATEINVSEIMNSQEGILLTEEEWKKQEQQGILAEYEVDEKRLYTLEFVGVPNK